MADPGFVYALINPSMPDLVKVGETGRSPEERAAELSASTGVPTAFVVVYSEYFGDRQAAEKWCHADLEASGYRASANREFFKVAVPEAVKTIMRCPGRATPQESVDTKPRTEVALSAEDAFVAGVEAFFGTTKTIRDYGTAFRLFQIASHGNVPSALYYIGLMQARGLGTARSTQRAIESLRRGAEFGAAICYAEMAVSCYRKDVSAKQQALEALSRSSHIADIDPRLEAYILEYAITIIENDRCEYGFVSESAVPSEFARVLRGCQAMHRHRLAVYDARNKKGFSLRRTKADDDYDILEALEKL